MDIRSGARDHAGQTDAALDGAARWRRRFRAWIQIVRANGIRCHGVQQFWKAQLTVNPNPTQRTPFGDERAASSIGLANGGGEALAVPHKNMQSALIFSKTDAICTYARYCSTGGNSVSIDGCGPCNGSCESGILDVGTVVSQRGDRRSHRVIFRRQRNRAVLRTLDDQGMIGSRIKRGNHATGNVSGTRCFTGHAVAARGTRNCFAAPQKLR
jgi:hypothetical protein